MHKLSRQFKIGNAVWSSSNELLYARWVSSSPGSYLFSPWSNENQEGHHQTDKSQVQCNTPEQLFVPFIRWQKVSLASDSGHADVCNEIENVCASYAVPKTYVINPGATINTAILQFSVLFSVASHLLLSRSANKTVLVSEINLQVWRHQENLWAMVEKVTTSSSFCLSSLFVH